MTCDTGIDSGTKILVDIMQTFSLRLQLINRFGIKAEDLKMLDIK